MRVYYKLVFILQSCLFLYPAVNVAQSGILDSNNTWYIRINYDQGNPFQRVEYGYQKFEGDTTVLSRYWSDTTSKLRNYQIIKGIECEHYLCAIREENSRVYTLEKYNHDSGWVEKLVYDFNLVVGDSMIPPRSQYQGGNKWYKIKKIDSVLFQGNYIKRQIIDYFEEIEVYEGIGSHVELRDWPTDHWEVATLLCFTKGEDRFIPKYGKKERCHTYVGENEIKDLTSQLKIFSFKNLLTVNMAEPAMELEMKIFNSTGRVVYKKSFKNTDFIETQLIIPTGIYYVRLMMDGNLISRKILIEN